MALGPFITYVPPGGGVPLVGPPTPPERIQRLLGEQEVDRARHIYRMRGVRAFEHFVCIQVSILESNLNLRERPVAAVLDDEVEAYGGWQKVADEMFGTPQGKQIPGLLARGRPIAVGEPEPDER